jgi:phytoene synthase
MACSVAESYDHCRALARGTARNFYYSFLTLPRDRQPAMCALYAFMRVTDDLGDSDEPQAVRSAQLKQWRASLVWACETIQRDTAPGETASGGSVQCDHPVLPALADTVRRYGLPVQYLLDVIAGVEMDLQPVAYETFEKLADYCYHVAGAVGLSCIHLWGFHDERAVAAAIDCGTAFQLTNILRDVREDAARGRVYLPAEDLERFHLTAGELAAHDPSRDRADNRFRQLMQFEVSRAREYYARAQALFAWLDRPGQPILETMLRIYGGLLDEIERRDYDVFTRRVELSRWRKSCILAQTLARHKLRNLFSRS